MCVISQQYCIFMYTKIIFFFKKSISKKGKYKQINFNKSNINNLRPKYVYVKADCNWYDMMGDNNQMNIVNLN